VALDSHRVSQQAPIPVNCLHSQFFTHALCGHIRMCALTHPSTYLHTHLHAHRQTGIHTDIYIHTHIHTYKYKHSNTRRDTTGIQTGIDTDTHALIDTAIHAGTYLGVLSYTNRLRQGAHTGIHVVHKHIYARTHEQ